MAFLLRRNLSSILKTTQTTPTKITSSIPTLTSKFGSTIVKPPSSDHNRWFRLRVRTGETDDEEEDGDKFDKSKFEAITVKEFKKRFKEAQIMVPVDKDIPVNVVFNGENEEERLKMMFAKAMELASEDPVVDLCWRKIMRLNFEGALCRFGSHSSLLGKQFTCLQLIVIDENRSIQEKLFVCNPKIDPDDPDVAKSSRHLFQVASSALLHDTDHWVFSRSLVFKPYYGMIDEALEFTSYDPIGGLDAIKDVPVGPSGDMKAFKAMIAEASWKVSKNVPEIPIGIRCSEIFMCIVGDYAVNDGGLNNREAVQKILHELSTEEGLLKIQVCDVACGSSKTSPENLAVIKDVHATS